MYSAPVPVPVSAPGLSAAVQRGGASSPETPRNIRPPPRAGSVTTHVPGPSLGRMLAPKQAPPLDRPAPPESHAFSEAERARQRTGANSPVDVDGHHAAHRKAFERVRQDNDIAVSQRLVQQTLAHLGSQRRTTWGGGSAATPMEQESSALNSGRGGRRSTMSDLPYNDIRTSVSVGPIRAMKFLGPAAGAPAVYVDYNAEVRRGTSVLCVCLRILCSLCVEDYIAEVRHYIRASAYAVRARHVHMHVHSASCAWTYECAKYVK